MLTNGKVSLESINKKIDKLIKDQEFNNMLRDIKGGRKIVGDELKEWVGILTAKGWSISVLKDMFNCSQYTISNKRKEITMAIKGLMDKGQDIEQISLELNYEKSVVLHFMEKIKNKNTDDEEIDFGD